MLIGRQSADFVCDFSCFLVSVGNKKIINYHFFLIGRLSLGLGKQFLVDRPSVDYRPVIGRRSADTPPTSFLKLNHSKLADCLPIIGRQSAE